MSTRIKLRADGQPDMRKNNGGRREGAGRPGFYDERTRQLSISIPPTLAERIRKAAGLEGKSIGQFVSEWAQTLPTSAVEKTRDMNKEKEVARELK